MKTVLDLLREFVTLNEAKVRKGARLSPKSYKRWSELKSFYDRLMGENGVSRGTVTRRFAAAEIREGLPRRQHLRVPLFMDIVFEHEGEIHSGRITNLSGGGVFVKSDTLLDADSKVTLYLANIGRGGEAVVTVEGEVAWLRPIAEGKHPRGMGIRFVNVPETVQDQLDGFVLETLEKHLTGLSPSLFGPDFLDREKIKL